MKPSEKISILRHKKGYSVTDIASELNLSSYEVMDWEEGKTDVPDPYLYPLCKLLGISVSDFLDNSFTLKDDLVNHEEKKDEERNEEAPIFEYRSPETPVYQDPFGESPISSQKTSEETNKMVRRYKRIIYFLRTIDVLIIILFFAMTVMASGGLLPNFAIFLSIFFGVYFFILLLIFFASTDVKKYVYKGHDIVVLYIFVVNRIYVDGVRTKITIIPGVHKGEAAMGWIMVGEEKLHYGAHSLYTENGEKIPEAE